MIQKIVIAIILLITLIYLFRYYYQQFSLKKKAVCGGCEKNCEASTEKTIAFPKALTKFSHSVGKPFSNHGRHPPSNE